MEVDERKEGTVGKKKEEMPEEAENDEFKNEDTETDDEAKKEVVSYFILIATIIPPMQCETFMVRGSRRKWKRLSMRRKK